MHIYIVRHGETSANAEGSLQGWSDFELNDNGRELAEVTGKALQGIHFDACISSPLVRAKETARIILKASGNGETGISCDNRIKEIHMGEWEGKKVRPGESEVDEDLMKIFFDDPFRFPGAPGGETASDVCRRTQEFLRELVERDDGRTYLVATHGFALRAMLNPLYEDPSDFWQGHLPPNCSLSILSAEGGNVRIIERDRIFYDPSAVVDHYTE